MNDILNQLNQEQQKAVTHTDGPIIILAGAGSGKTRVLIHKVLYLVIKKGVNPSNILMVTFTNKAAGEMLDRIVKVFAKNKIHERPTVGTFHSLCAKILRREGRAIGIPIGFQIFDDQDQLETIKEAFTFLGLNPKEVRPNAVLSMISQAKNQMIDQEVYQTIAHGYFQEQVASVYPVYQKLLKERDALDFDDLLLETLNLFKKAPEILDRYQNKFRYVMVDEYQDTNEAQYQLTKLLGGKSQNICIVGDFSQSIYSFRGADFRNLEKFKRDFPNAVTFPLSQNYRSTKKILDAATSVISNNTMHPVLSLWTENQTGEDIVIFPAESEHNEAEFIIQQILEAKHKRRDLKFSDVAVLYRTNAQSRAIEETFLHNAIPYILVGGTRFYERKEIKDIIAYLAFLANPKNKVALKRITKIGKRRADKFLEYSSQLKEGYIKQNSTIELLDKILNITGYLDLYDEKDPEDKARIENIKELRSVAIEFPDLVQFLENVALVEQEYSSTSLRANMPDKIIKDEKDSITLMTMHAAKGLEFKIIFIIGMEEGLFPHSQSMLDAHEIEEERRLCYVGITRAKEKLFLCFAKRRLYFGQIVSNPISRFIYELPEEVLRKNYIERYSDEPSYL
jgi:DNA helicase-2/ATP-dependent DNA helicase PcrA